LENRRSRRGAAGGGLASWGVVDGFRFMARWRSRYSAGSLTMVSQKFSMLRTTLMN
jgi:hypothetical protein